MHLGERPGKAALAPRILVIHVGDQDLPKGPEDLEAAAARKVVPGRLRIRPRDLLPAEGWRRSEGRTEWRKPPCSATMFMTNVKDGFQCSHRAVI